MHSFKLGIVAVMVCALSAGCRSAPAPSRFEGNLTDVLVAGSPWVVAWDAGGARGRFNQSFSGNPDGSLTAKSDEVGPYQTILRVAPDRKSATWTSPHGRVVTLTLDRGTPYGEGGGVRLYFTSARK